MSSLTWACPSCKRRVPNRVSTCHCGTTRDQADQVAAAQNAASKRPAPRAWTPRPRPIPRAPLGRDVKALLAVLVLVLLLAVGRLFMPWQPTTVHPVLGFTEVGTPRSAPTPEPVGTPAPAPAHSTAR